MANNFRNPWVIDTPSANALAPNRVWIKSLIWTGYTDATHKCVVKDTVRDVVVLTLDGDVNLGDVQINGPIMINKPAIITLNSGAVSVFIE